MKVWIAFAVGMVASATLASETVVSVDLSNTTGPSVSKMLYGMNVARWDHQLFPTSDTQMLLDCDRDAIRKLAELQTGFLKYPGGNDADSYVWNSPDNKAHDMNTTEFLHMARVCDVPSFFTVNYTAGPDLAAEWVKFVNGPASPAKVTMWEVGDEVWGPWAKSHTSGEGYAKRFRQFSEAMRKADPSIKLAANLALAGADTTWTQDALRHLGDSFEIITMTFFPLNPPKETDEELLRSPQQYRRFFRGLEKAVARALPEKARPQYCLVGFNSTSGKPGPQTTQMVNAVFMAQMFGAMAETGTDMACWWAFHNEYPPRKGDFGVLSSTPENKPYYTYWVLKMLSGGFIGKLVSAEKHDSLETYCVVRDGGGAAVLAINTSPLESAELKVRFSGTTDWKTATVDQVESSSLSIQRKTASSVSDILNNDGTKATLSLPGQLPPYSVTLCTLE